MYPAQQLANDDYSENDLPDAVTVDGVSFNRSGTGYGNTSNGVILEGNVWAKYASGSRSSRPCLIQGGVVDQFADTYTLTQSISEFADGWSSICDGSGLGLNTSMTLERTGLCIWEGELKDVFDKPFCGPVTIYARILYIDYLGIGFKPGWFALIDWFDSNGNSVIDPGFSTTGAFKSEEEYQSTPTGLYNDFDDSVFPYPITIA
jgi:hypothetical protein